MVEGRSAALLGQQGFDFAPQFRIGPRQKRRALARLALQGRVVQFLDLLPARRSHEPWVLGVSTMVLRGDGGNHRALGAAGRACRETVANHLYVHRGKPEQAALHQSVVRRIPHGFHDTARGMPVDSLQDMRDLMNDYICHERRQQPGIGLGNPVVEHLDVHTLRTAKRRPVRRDERFSESSP